MNKVNDKIFTAARKLLLLLVSFYVLFSGIPATGQTGYGQPVYKQDFGFGNQNPSTFGPPLPAYQTELPYQAKGCPDPGYYTILRRVPVDGCFDGLWIDLTHDANTTFELGMMMMMNNNPSPVNRLVFRDTAYKPLCPGATYRYSFAVINLDLIDANAHCIYGPDYPVLEMRLEDGLGNLIKKDTTPPIPSHPVRSLLGYFFTEIGFEFIMPAGVNKLVMKLTLLHDSYICADDFAIDDVQIRPVGPEIFMQFAGEPTTFVKSVCFQHNPTVTVTGTMGTYYPNPSLQWQKSVDGANWTDIPGATSAAYTNTYSIPDTFWIRLSGGDASTIANPYCRVVSNVVRLEINGLPTGYTITSNSPVCAGEDLQFKAEGAATYLWTGPNGFHDNIATPHIYSCSLEDSGMYHVQIFSLGGCTTTDSIRATVIGTNVKAWPDTAICKSEMVLLRSSQGVSYEWTPAEGLSSTNTSNPRATPETTTIYKVKVTDRYGCSDTAHVTVIVRNTVPVKAVPVALEHLCRPYDSLRFSDQSLGVIKNRFWTFGNGNASTEANPPLQFFSIPNGTNTVVARLVVTDTAGCTDTAFHFMKVEDNCYMAVPTAFTPNNDGKNDYLYPVNAFKVTSILFRVYNRQGQLVFESRDPAGKWNGKVGDIEQPAGVYIWTLDYTDMAERKVALKGTSVLIR